MDNEKCPDCGRDNDSRKKFEANQKIKMLRFRCTIIEDACGIFSRRHAIENFTQKAEVHKKVQVWRLTLKSIIFRWRWHI